LASGFGFDTQNMPSSIKNKNLLNSYIKSDNDYDTKTPKKRYNTLTSLIEDIGSSPKNKNTVKTSSKDHGKNILTSNELFENPFNSDYDKKTDKKELYN